MHRVQKLSNPKQILCIFCFNKAFITALNVVSLHSLCGIGCAYLCVSRTRIGANMSLAFVHKYQISVVD
jgi:hypothetical protein